MIPDRFFYPLAALIVAALIGLALRPYEGQGAPSSGAVRALIAQPAAPAAAK